ncbi:hypothetical protein D918_06454 [Trichuris suis]|nr:hypothetical protein D918_06454 [Trichuris suis]
MRPRLHYHVVLKREGALWKIQFVLFPEGTDMSLCKQSVQDEFAPQTEKKSNRASKKAISLPEATAPNECKQENQVESFVNRVKLPSVWHVRCPEEKVLPSHTDMTSACSKGKTTAADAAPYLTMLLRYMFHVLNLIMK